MGQILEKKTLLKTGRIEVISAKARLANDNLVEYSYTKFPVTVSIVPVDGKGNVYLVREWRVAWDRQILQLPAGVCEEGENTSIRARKELEEEAGLSAGKLEKLVSAGVSANSNGMHHIFLATDLKETGRNLDENEIIEVVKMPIDKALKMFIDGELTTAYTILGLSLAKEKLKL